MKCNIQHLKATKTPTQTGSAVTLVLANEKPTSTPFKVTNLKERSPDRDFGFSYTYDITLETVLGTVSVPGSISCREDGDTFCSTVGFNARGSIEGERRPIEEVTNPHCLFQRPGAPWLEIKDDETAQALVTDLFFALAEQLFEIEPRFRILAVSAHQGRYSNFDVEAFIYTPEGTSVSFVYSPQGFEQLVGDLGAKHFESTEALLRREVIELNRYGYVIDTADFSPCLLSHGRYLTENKAPNTVWLWLSFPLNTPEGEPLSLFAEVRLEDVQRKRKAHIEVSVIGPERCPGLADQNTFIRAKENEIRSVSERFARFALASLASAGHPVARIAAKKKSLSVSIEISSLYYPDAWKFSLGSLSPEEQGLADALGPRLVHERFEFTGYTHTTSAEGWYCPIPELRNVHFTQKISVEGEAANFATATKLVTSKDASSWLYTAKQVPAESASSEVLKFDIEGCLIAGHDSLNRIVEAGEPLELSMVIPVRGTV